MEAAVDAPPEDAFVPAPHRPFPVLPRNGPAQLSPARIVMIVGPDEPLQDGLFAYADALATSEWARVAGEPYGVTLAPEVLHIMGHAHPDRMNFQALRAYVREVIAAHPEARPDGHTVYMFVFQPGTHFGRIDEPICDEEIGAHSVFELAPWTGTATDALGFAQRCPSDSGLDELAEISETVSHEIIEAATDSNPPNGWVLRPGHDTLEGTEPPWALPVWSYFQRGGVENADLCTGTLYREGDHVFTRNWSPAAAARGGDPCVPALMEPYYSATTETEWVTLPAGVSTQVPVTGWSTGPRADWSVTAVTVRQSERGFAALFPGSARSAMVNNGTTAMLSITTPSTPGAWAIVHLVSSASPPRRAVLGWGSIPAPETGDIRHHQVLGVHTSRRGATRPNGCGDNACSTGETCATCPDDCGACGSVCGAVNLSVTCGTTRCPTGSTCSGGRCVCGTGTLASTCAGAACPAGGCTGSNWWCGRCGLPNFIVECPGGGACPAFSACTATGCQCNAGYQAVSCTGAPCTTRGACTYPEYWCARM